MSRTRDLDLASHMATVAVALRRRAKLGTFDGRATPAMSLYLEQCRFDDVRTGTRMIFTRDTGHHTSGWWKNPDYERCWHLSTSPLPRMIVTVEPVLAELSKATLRAWIEAFFGDDVRSVWAEPPYSDRGRAIGVWHWRLFCDEHWRPIVPRGEVYSREFTEAGWRSASQVLADERAKQVEEEG